MELKKYNNDDHIKLGKKWFLGFMKRHPDISKRVSENLVNSRKDVTEEQIRSWFLKVEESNPTTFDILNDPSQKAVAFEKTKNETEPQTVKGFVPNDQATFETLEHYIGKEKLAAFTTSVDVGMVISKIPLCLQFRKPLKMNYWAIIL